MGLRIGIIGAGSIAAEFADANAIAAVASRDRGRAEAFASAHDVPRAYGSYPELLADAELDAVYIATPHRQHAEWTLAALAAGKHVLCEKPLTINAAEAERVISAARGRRTAGDGGLRLPPPPPDDAACSS